MDLPHEGCSFESCQHVDFLPIECSLCHLKFCRHHAFPDSHLCAAPPPPQIPANLQPLVSCQQVGCSGLSLNQCELCCLSFCAAHRHPPDHGCAVSLSQGGTLKTEAARALLAKVFPSSSAQKKLPPTKPEPKLPTDPLKRARYDRLQLMKLQHSAVPANPNDKACSLEDRLHVRAKTRLGKDTVQEKNLWFRKSVTAGRALDLMAQSFKLNETAVRHLEQLDPEGSCKRLALDQPLSNNVEDGSEVWVIDSTA